MENKVPDTLINQIRYKEATHKFDYYTRVLNDLETKDMPQSEKDKAREKALRQQKKYKKEIDLCSESGVMSPEDYKKGKKSPAE